MVTEKRQHLVDGQHSLQDLVDTAHLRAMCEGFSQATGLTTELVSYPARELVFSTGRRDICAKFHRACPAALNHCRQNDSGLTAQEKEQKKTYIRICENGLVNGATPIIVGNARLADLFAGQVLLDPPDPERFKRQAEAYGFDTAAYLKALEQVPVVTEKELRRALSFLNDMAVMLLDHGQKKLCRWRDKGIPAASRLSLDDSIADRLQTEEALRKSEEKYRSLFNQSVEGIYLHDLEGRILDVNQMACLQSGYSRDELLRLTIFDLHPEKTEKDEIIRQWRQWKREQRVALEGKHRRKDATVYPVEVSTGIIRYEDRSLMLAIVQDITERKRAEEQLRDSEARFRALFNHAAEGILVADIQSRKFVYANPTICEMLGYSEQELTRLTLNEIHPRDSLEQTIRNFEAQARGEIRLAPDTPCLRKDGRVIYADINTARVELGGRAHNIGLFTDITARRNAEKERQRMQKLESLGTIAGGIAHDFNNLLMGVFGNIEMAKMDLPDDHQSGDYLNNAYSALERARRLTSQLLTFAKGGDPVIETLDIKSLVREAVTFNLSGSSVLPRFDLRENLWPVRADRGQLGQVLANLIINAKQAMPGGGHLYVAGANVEDAADDYAIPSSDKYVRLSIRDEGVGVPSRIIDRIFDPYFTTKQNGSGLGLAIVHSIITRHGGRISVESTSDAGSTFTVLLPADPSGVAEVSATRLQEEEERNSRVSCHILFMDDNEAIRILGMKMLSSFGHTVDLAVNGEEALDKYVSAMKSGKPFDLVILDLTIPGGMGGKETVAALLAVDANARVIVSSGYSSDPVIAGYSAYGFSGCLVKPFEIAALNQEIARVMKPVR